MNDAKRKTRDQNIASAYATGDVTLQELADKYGISRERVRQIVAKQDPTMPARVMDKRKQRRRASDTEDEVDAMIAAAKHGAYCVMCGQLVTRRYNYPGNDRGGFALTCSPECAEDYPVVRDLIDEKRARARREAHANTVLANPKGYSDSQVRWAKRWKRGTAEMRTKSWFLPGSERERIAEKWGLK